MGIPQAMLFLFIINVVYTQMIGNPRSLFEEGNDYVFKAPLPTRCVTVKGLPSKFPFIYKGKTFEKCTTYDSENGQPWCPWEVDDYKKANPLKLDDCVPGCPVKYWDGDDDEPKTCAEVKQEKDTGL